MNYIQMDKNKNVLSSAVAQSKLELIVNKLSRIEKKVDILEKMEQEEEIEEKKIEAKEEELLAEEKKIEKVLFKLGNMTFRRKHLLEIIRASAGAFLGVGLGRSIIGLQSLAQKLPWENIIAILIFVLVISGLLIYKNERSFLQSAGKRVVFRKLASMYFIALMIEFLSLVLFADLPVDFETLMKVLIIGSYAAMAGAVSFSLI